MVRSVHQARSGAGTTSTPTDGCRQDRRSRWHPPVPSVCDDGCSQTVRPVGPIVLHHPLAADAFDAGFTTGSPQPAATARPAERAELPLSAAGGVRLHLQSGRALARATSPSQRALGFGVRSKVVRSTSTRPKRGP